MKATIIHGERDIRFEEAPDPVLSAPTDAIVKVVASCICGSDLWPYRGEDKTDEAHTIGHECLGVVEEVGTEVRDFRAGDFVVVPFDHCDNTCAALALSAASTALSTAGPTCWFISSMSAMREARSCSMRLRASSATRLRSVSRFTLATRVAFMFSS